jgi:hypothetical protein
VLVNYGQICPENTKYNQNGRHNDSLLLLSLTIRLIEEAGWENRGE